MANKLQQSAANRKLKHVPNDGSELYVKEASPENIEDFKALKRAVGLMYMGLNDARKWCKEIEDAIGGLDDKTEDYALAELRVLRGRVENLEKQLKAALEDVSDTATTTTS